MSECIDSKDWHGDCRCHRSDVDKVQAKLVLVKRIAATYLLELALTKSKIRQTVQNSSDKKSEKNKHQKIDRKDLRLVRQL